MTDLIGRTLGHYRIVEKIGAGGMGVVYRAHDERLDRDVAIKVLPEEVAGDRSRLARFEREAKALAALNHPNIASVFGLETMDSDSDSDADSDAGQSFLVMELLEGESFRGLITKGGITTGKAVEYAGAIADGLAAAHDKGIIHRDLKPENVFLTKDGRIKILDFGLAKLGLPEGDLTTEDVTATLGTAPGSLMGTLPYMAPEQIRDQPTDHRSDIFALGVVLYEMLTGRRPFGGSTSVKTAAAILAEDPKPIQSLAPAVPPSLVSVVSRCLEKRPGDRFSSAHDLSLTLSAVDTSSSNPPIERRSATGRRWLLILAIITLTLVALLVVLPPEGLWQRFSGRRSVGPIRSIAVLPLANLTGDPEQEYFADGMTDALISKLAQIGSLDVISRTSVMLYKDSIAPLPQIARELGVDGVVEGSVTRDENNVRITVQLIHGATDRHLWAEDYQRPLRDVLFLQAEVAQAVAKEIDAALTAEESSRLVDSRTVDPDAHEAFLKGMHHFLLFTGDGLTKGAEYLEHAVEIDPEYAEAYAALAAIQLNSTYFLALPPTEVVPRARAYLSRALQLDPDNANAVLVKGWIEMTYDWDWDAAERSHLRALELGPSWSQVHSNYAYLLACQGDVEEAVVEARRAERLDPLSALASQQVGMMLYLARRYDESIAQFESTIELSPYYWFTYQRLAQGQIATEEYDRGIEVMRKGIELAGPDTLRTGKHTLAYLHALSGNRAEAVKILREIEEQEKTMYVPPCDLAQVHTALGNVDEAFRWLDRAVEVRDADLFMTKVWPVWDPLRSDPRFDRLLRRLNLSGD
jgi:serine/threonine protein kinase/Tfp pilus assembly protein PilF